MSKKELLKRYIVFLIGLAIASFGVAFITKANLGTSPISSIPYVLSLGFSPTIGEFTILFSLLLIVLQVLLLGKKFRPRQLLQIPVSVLFGYLIDGSMWILSALNPTFYPVKLICLGVGSVILGVGVYGEVLGNVVMLPGEGVVSALSQRLHTEFGATKIAVDVTMSLTALVISLVLFHQLSGVREGTVFAALLVGLVTRFCGRKLGFLQEKLYGTSHEA